MAKVIAVFQVNVQCSMSPVTLTFAIVLSFLVIIEGSATQWRNKQETGSNDTVENENCPYTWLSPK